MHELVHILFVPIFLNTYIGASLKFSEFELLFFFLLLFYRKFHRPVVELEVYSEPLIIK